MITIELLNICIAFCTLIASFFFILEQYQKDESSEFRNYLIKLWNDVSLSKWAVLPKKGLKVFTYFVDLPNIIYSNLISNDKSEKWTPLEYLIALIALSPLILGFINYIYFDQENELLLSKAFSSYLFQSPIFKIFLGSAFIISLIKIDKLRKIRYYTIIFIRLLFLLITCIITFDTIEIVTNSITSILFFFDNNIFLLDYILMFISVTLIAIFLTLPFFYVLGGVASFYYEITKDNIFDKKMGSLFISLAFATTISCIAIFIGFNYTKANFVLPQPMLFSNYIFDYLTLFTSFFIIKLIIKRESILIGIVLILIDLFLAGIFAYLSLYIGLSITGIEVSFIELNNFFVFNYEGNSFSYENSIYFSILMHTSFTPVFFYLSSILIVFIMKGILLSSEKIFIRSYEKKKPYSLLRSVFLSLAVIGGVVKVLM